MKQKYYIAVSIHGTNCFITANKTVSDVKQLGSGFTVVASRRPDYKSEDGIKLHYDQLMTKAGKPLRCPIRILSVFNALEKVGWEVNKASFVKKHWQKK